MRVICHSSGFPIHLATASETGSDDGCFNEAPASADLAGVLHQSLLMHKGGFCCSVIGNKLALVPKPAPTVAGVCPDN